MRVLVTGGGTAGHIHPALSVAEQLEADDVHVGYVGTPDGAEAGAARGAGLDYLPLRSRGFDRGSRLSAIPAALTAIVSVVRALRLVKRFRADAVVGFGGYVALPLGLAAVVRRVPLILHEQNSVPGLANRVLSRWASAVAATYASSTEHFAHPERVVVTGNPVRGSVVQADRDAGREALDLHSAALVLLVFGGSRGARHLNDAVTDLAGELLAVPGVVVVHIAGPAEYDAVVSKVAAAGIDTNRYRVLEWLDDMGGALAAADLVVSRAGATSIAEVTTVGRAAVLVPYPYATDDHQTGNARALQDAGAAAMVADAELDTRVFGEVVTGLLDNRAAREKMATASLGLAIPDAADRVVGLIRDHARSDR